MIPPAKCFNPAVNEPDPLLAIPAAGIFDGPTNQAGINGDWSSLIVGALLHLSDPTIWDGDEVQRHQAIQEIERFLALFTGVASTPITNMEVAIIEDRKPSGTDGGTATSGAWRTRDLNTVTAAQAWLSLSSNQVTLQPGAYLIRWRCPVVAVRSHTTRLYDVTGSVLAVGAAAATYDNNEMSDSVGVARITIATLKTIELQHRVTSTTVTIGWGRSTNFGDEIYSQVEILRLSE